MTTSGDVGLVQIHVTASEVRLLPVDPDIHGRARAELSEGGLTDENWIVTQTEKSRLLERFVGLLYKLPLPQRGPFRYWFDKLRWRRCGLMLTALEGMQGKGQSTILVTVQSLGMCFDHFYQLMKLRDGEIVDTDVVINSYLTARKQTLSPEPYHRFITEYWMSRR